VEPIINNCMFQCAVCAELFSSIMALTGHKRMHGQSNGKSKKIICSCVITRQVMPYQYLEMYQEKLVGCKQCDKLFHPTASRTTFCSRSCAATYNNKVYVKRKKQEKPTKIIKERKTYTKKEKAPEILRLFKRIEHGNIVQHCQTLIENLSTRFMRCAQKITK